MKTKITLLILLFATLANAQTPTWDWGRQDSGVGPSYGFGVATDASGNVFATGGAFGNYYMGTGLSPIFNTISFSVPQNYETVFIVKYSSTGAVIWANIAIVSGGGSFNEAHAIATDLFGNSYITGYFTSPTIIFGTDTLIGTTGLNNIFIVKYSPTGTVLWAKKGTGNGKGNSIATDASGDVYITGDFYSPTLVMDTITLTNASSGGTTADMFIAKYSSAGSVLWAKRAGSVNTDKGNSVAVDGSGNVLITGDYSNTITFGGTLLNNGPNGLYVVKYSPAGTVIWAQSSGKATGNGITTDVLGSVYVTGVYNSSGLVFGTDTMPNVSNTIFVAKYSSTGTALWGRYAKGNAPTDGFNIAADGTGINVTGDNTAGNQQFSFGVDTLYPCPSCGSGPPAFVVKYDFNGNVVCAGLINNGGSDKSSITTDGFGNTYVTGNMYAGSFTFGGDTIRAVTQLFFIAKYNCGTLGVNQIKNDETTTIYPNPFYSQTTISFSEEQKNTTIKITDIVGKEIKTIHFTGKEFVIDRGTMSNGIYFVQITDSTKNVINKKIVVQ